MSKYLISVSEVYRVDNDAEAEALIAEAKEDSKYELKKYKCENKQVKAKGEIVDEYVKVVLDKVFTAEKEPDAQVSISYSTGAF